MALTPAGVAALKKAGFKNVVVEASAGKMANFSVGLQSMSLWVQGRLEAWVFMLHVVSC